MFVAKTVSLDLDDLQKVQKIIWNGESDNLSQFVRIAIKMELERRKKSC
ncbi:MAG: hypothetical protein NKF70_14600 [Methanobacterium sp. ERen5]|nr:MAG: hypothetical protein NKF70_14600 [Methanobacterium sp. ERen5]